MDPHNAPILTVLHTVGGYDPAKELIQGPMHFSIVMCVYGDREGHSFDDLRPFNHKKLPSG